MSTTPFFRKNPPCLRATQSNKLMTGPPEIKVMETSKLMPSLGKMELFLGFSLRQGAPPLPPPFYEFEEEN